MKNTLSFSMFDNARQFRTNNPLLNALLLLIVIIAVPIILVLGVFTLLSIALIARFKVLTNVPKKPATNNNNDGYTDYEIVEEELGK